MANYVCMYICSDKLYIIYDWFLQPSSQVCDLVFNYFLRKTSFSESIHGIFVYSPSFCQKSAENKWPKEYILHILLMISDLGFETRHHV